MKNMTNKRNWMGMLAIVLVSGVIITGCASVVPMSNEAVRNYGLASNPGNFRNFQYFVSRDIVLTYVSTEAETIGVGQIRIHREIVQILSSTPGVVIGVDEYADGSKMLGVAFEESDDDLLWFIQAPDRLGHFYLAYTNPARREIMFGGSLFFVSYEQAVGVGATFSRLNPFTSRRRAFEDTAPILLFEERVRESEQRRNVQGRRL